MARNNEQTPVEQQFLLGVDRLEHSIADCEELLASMQAATHPVADRNKYLLGVKLANIRQQLQDAHTASRARSTAPIQLAATGQGGVQHPDVSSEAEDGTE